MCFKKFNKIIVLSIGKHVFHTILINLIILRKSKIGIYKTVNEILYKLHIFFQV